MRRFLLASLNLLIGIGFEVSGIEDLRAAVAVWSYCVVATLVVVITWPPVMRHLPVIRRYAPRDYRPVRETLWQLYRESEALSARRPENEADFRQYRIDVVTWITRARDYIRSNLNDAAFSRFNYTEGILPFRKATDHNEEHRTLRNMLNRCRENLAAIIEGGYYPDIEQG